MCKPVFFYFQSIVNLDHFRICLPNAITRLVVWCYIIHSVIFQTAGIFIFTVAKFVSLQPLKTCVEWGYRSTHSLHL